jgi:hypothetical protein
VKEHLVRAAGTVAGLALAASIAMPVLAASPSPVAPGGAQVLDAPNNRALCATEWLQVRADRSVANLQAAGLCEIDRRLATIARLQTQVQQATAFTDAHRAALGTILTDDTSGLTALRAEIGADDSVTAVTADIRMIFADYRIYALVTRQVALVHADDRVGVASDRLVQASDQLAAAIDRAAANGKDVTAAQGHLDAMNAAITKARAEVAGDADAILAQTPATWNAGTAVPVLDAARASISAARTDLRTALSEARAVLAALR